MNPSSADEFLELLEKSDSKLNVLLGFLNFLFPTLGSSLDNRKMIARLMNVYGARTVFFSLLDCYDVENISGSMYPLLAYFCKRRLNKSAPQASSISLDDVISKNIKSINSKRKVKIPNIFGENNAK